MKPAGRFVKKKTYNHTKFLKWCKIIKKGELDGGKDSGRSVKWLHAIL